MDLPFDKKVPTGLGKFYSLASGKRDFPYLCVVKPKARNYGNKKDNNEDGQADQERD